MVQVASLFNQLLYHFPRLEFAALVKKHKAERAAKGFNCWTQLVAMLFCQPGHADSLREICNGLSCCLGKLVHLCIGTAPNQSTLSYANEHRPAALYEELFYTALKQNLKIKSFVGTSENALHIQIWRALIAMLLLKWLHHLSQANGSLSNLATMLRLNFIYLSGLARLAAKPVWYAADFSWPPATGPCPGLIGTGERTYETSTSSPILDSPCPKAFPCNGDVQD